MSLLITILAAQADPLVAIVVVDQEARDQGYALQLDGWLIEDALPIDVVEGEMVHLVDADGRKELLDVAAGEAWEITGHGAEAWMSTLNDEVRTDLVAIRGDAEAIVDLATRLDVELLRDGDEYYLKGASVLFAVPWVESRVAQRIDEVRLVRVGDRIDAEKQARPVRTAADPSTRMGLSRAPTRAPAAASVATPAPAAAAAPIAAVEPAFIKPMVHIPLPIREKPEPVPEVVDPASIDRSADLARTREALMADYVGLYDCRDNGLLLHDAGVYAFAGEVGEWTVSAPGVVHLLHTDGTLWVKAAIDAPNHHCREVW